MRRYSTGLYALLSTSIVLLMLWGVDLSRSAALEQTAADYRTEVGVWADESFSDMLQDALTVRESDEYYRVIDLSSDSRAIVWNYDSSWDNAAEGPAGDNRQLYLSNMDRDQYEGSVILIAHTTPSGPVIASVHWIVYQDQPPSAKAMPEQTPRAPVDLPIAYPFGP